MIGICLIQVATIQAVQDLQILAEHLETSAESVQCLYGLDESMIFGTCLGHPL